MNSEILIVLLSIGGTALGAVIGAGTSILVTKIQLSAAHKAFKGDVIQRNIFYP